MNARCNSVHHLATAYLFFHPTHLCFVSFWQRVYTLHLFTQRLSVWRRAELTSCSTHTKDSFSPQVLELHELESAAGVSPNPGPGTTHRSLSGFQLKHTVEFAVSPPKKGIWTPGLGQMHVSVSVYWGKLLNSVGLQISWKKMWGRLTSGLQTQKCCGKKKLWVYG